LKFYGAHTELTYRCLFQAPEDEVHKEFLAFHSSRVCAVNDDLGFHDLLLPKEKARLEVYAKHDAEAQRTDKMRQVVRLFDLHQNPNVRPRASILQFGNKDTNLLPSLVSHGVLWCPVEQRWLLVLEGGLAQGYPTLPNCCDTPSPVDWSLLLSEQKVPYNALRKIFGLSWHLPSIGSWVMYMLSCVEFKPSIDKLTASSMRTLSSSEDDAKRRRVFFEMIDSGEPQSPSASSSTTAQSPDTRMHAIMMAELMPIEVSDEEN